MQTASKKNSCGDFFYSMEGILQLWRNFSNAQSASIILAEIEAPERLNYFSKVKM